MHALACDWSDLAQWAGGGVGVGGRTSLLGLHTGQQVVAGLLEENVVVAFVRAVGVVVVTEIAQPVH